MIQPTAPHTLATHIVRVRVESIEYGTMNETDDPEFKTGTMTIGLKPVQFYKGECEMPAEMQVITAGRTYYSGKTRPREHTKVCIWDGWNPKVGDEVVLYLNAPGIGNWKQLPHELQTLAIVSAKDFKR